MRYLVPGRRKVNKSVIPHNIADERSTLNCRSVEDTLVKRSYAWWDFRKAQ